MDWRLANPAWLGVATQAGRQGKRPSVNNTAASVRALARELGRRLAVPLGPPPGG